MSILIQQFNVWTDFSPQISHTGKEVREGSFLFLIWWVVSENRKVSAFVFTIFFQWPGVGKEGQDGGAGEEAGMAGMLTHIKHHIRTKSYFTLRDKLMVGMVLG